uniref:Ig-like domain-containing protein n=1 Tax=Oreochromis aureus TaxID=47969 RepID=A0A668UKK1_OREAU
MYIFILKPLSCFLSPSDYKNIMSSLGQQVILPCNAPENMEVLAMQWSRCGLEEYVLHYRDDQLDPDGQDPSYMGRVNLTNTHMQNGNLSMILMNMTTADIGTYECIAFQRTSGMGRVVLSIINLNASQSGEFLKAEVGFLRDFYALFTTKSAVEPIENETSTLVKKKIIHASNLEQVQIKFLSKLYFKI